MWEWMKKRPLACASVVLILIFSVLWFFTARNLATLTRTAKESGAPVPTAFRLDRYPVAGAGNSTWRPGPGKTARCTRLR